MIIIDRHVPLPNDSGELNRRFPFLKDMRLGDSVLLDTNNSNIHDLRWSQKCHSTILKAYGWKASIRTLKWDKKTPIQVRIWRTS
tara:strand:- start:580 stop:834 length:255 start_codon:yes stop_codon:yes gene_type:complete